MPRELPSDVLSAQQLIRSGRFSETVAILDRLTELKSPSAPKAHPAALSLLADALQRIGRNDRAEAIVSRILQSANSSDASARCHFILGNVYRDRGETGKAIEHLRIAASLTGSDLELSCWINLRMMVVLGELSGPQTAMARMAEVRGVLTRFGDARPFAGLHLWLVEIDAMRGDLTHAREHLRTASSLLSTVDDVWLKGYLAINTSVIHYYSAEITEARNWAESATNYAQQSGHRATLRAAYANLGNIEFALGNHTHAEQCFERSLECCEPGSIHQVAILDNLAQIRLHQDDLEGCRTLVSHLEALVEQNNYAKRRHYNACALQTKVRLLLREGKHTEALKLIQDIAKLIKDLPQARINAEIQLLNAEALLADEQPAAAADALSSALTSTSAPTPDLFAKFEYVSGKTLAASGESAWARVRLERAVQTFGTIGHAIGENLSLAEISDLSLNKAGQLIATDSGVRMSVDRIRTLMDLRNRPELFGHEATLLLRDLECCSALRLSVREGSHQRLTQSTLESDDVTTSDEWISIAFDAGSNRNVVLAFNPLSDARSKLSSLNFCRLVKQILAIGNSEVAFTDRDIVWAAGEGPAANRGIVFGSDSMLAILRTVKRISTVDVSVLVTGETGVGKEVIARAIHDYSNRAGMPFLALNCAAVPKELLESQLFGHRKGAFSGAAEHHQGIVRAANGGTLFLDEIGEMPMDMQAKLLRFLEMSEVHPVGETQPVKVNVRLIFATNGDLEEAVSQNRFRQDLFYRLNVIPIKVPPLRERREEIPVLAHLFAQRFAAEFKKEPLQFSSNAMELLIVYAWPGNIRQLANEVRRLTALTESGACVTPEDLSPHLQAHKPRATGSEREDALQLRIDIEQPLDKATAQLESAMITHALRQARGHLSVAASNLGISRKGLYLKRMRLGLTDPHQRQY